MKRLIFVGALYLALLGTVTSAFAAKGIVVYIEGGCSYFIVENSLGYALLEWFGGSLPSRGDVVVGDYESYGMKDIYNLTRDSEIKVWVDNFWMSKDRIVERYIEKCR